MSMACSRCDLSANIYRGILLAIALVDVQVVGVGRGSVRVLVRVFVIMMMMLMLHLSGAHVSRMRLAYTSHIFLTGSGRHGTRATTTSHSTLGPLQPIDAVCKSLLLIETTQTLDQRAQVSVLVC